jgi:glutathione synthase/RimK-type ligase-like ATP-grasp enzyme
VPTVWADREAEADGVRAALGEARDRGWERIVMKPAVGAGAELLRVGELDGESEWLAHAAEIHRNSDAMVQPFVESIRDRGELSIVLIDGRVTHAVRKKPAAGDHRVQMEFGGRYELEEPSDSAKRVAGAAAALWRDMPLYARIDLVEPEADEYRIIEVELVEPELFFPLAPEAGEAIGAALRSRLEALR